MSILKAKEIGKMGLQDRQEKLKELKFSLLRSNVAANKSSGKTKEIKKAIARLLTYSRANPEEAKRK